jgi:hypothetical protein
MPLCISFSQALYETIYLVYFVYLILHQNIIYASSYTYSSGTLCIHPWKTEPNEVSSIGKMVLLERIQMNQKTLMEKG